MSHLVSTDLNDALLQPYAPKYLADVEAWIVEQAEAVGVLEADILVTLGNRAKRAAVYQLAIFTCLGEGGQNQLAFGADGKDAFMLKLKVYQDMQAGVLPTLGAADWSGTTEESGQTPSILCPSLYRA